MVRIQLGPTLTTTISCGGFPKTLDPHDPLVIKIFLFLLGTTKFPPMARVHCVTPYSPSRHFLEKART